MSSRRRLQLKTFLMILVMVIAGPLGNVLLGRGMKHAGPVALWPPAALVDTASRILHSGSVWLGVFCLLNFFVANILVLTWADYSFVQPASSVAYGVVALLAWLVLGERVTPLRWAGVLIICLGVFVVGQTHPRTTETHQETH